MIHKVLQFLRHKSRLHFNFNLIFQLNEYCHMIILSILTKGCLKRTQGMTQKDPLLHNSLIICILHFERGDSQQEIYLQLNLRNLPAELLRSLRQNNFEKMIHFTVDNNNSKFFNTALGGLVRY